MRIIFWAGFAAFITDQLTKYIVVHAMELSRVRSIDVFPPLLNFRYGENRGINFGLFGDGAESSRWILIGVAIAIYVGLLIWAGRQPLGLWAKVSAGVLIGGALANVVDRLIYGYVLDFLNTTCCGINNPFVFNTADIFIFAGALGLVFFIPNAKPTAQKPRKKGQ